MLLKTIESKVVMTLGAHDQNGPVDFRSPVRSTDGAADTIAVPLENRITVEDVEVPVGLCPSGRQKALYPVRSDDQILRTRNETVITPGAIIKH
jgi:hypothetical protein